ncbi:NAD(P)-dependent alcohol dehydrogenase [Aspergillus clavatus NRRL 1]|uniref:Alcohol dehydrogenase, putative n=1 Tax=Aspergillus clavatus (strain ATCC 1007 / CBS 513.65 / DSM 816 / NCTC 3887 / NRRL 1 / QM 1276 / 107) TaxID=344612 RepID=A1CCP4_ASPCL|nr:alcohol dehydrogenase, putative [Aspergillus clavatus NRRL 1]EAW12301.1 alcohol dehydrogenase, putative [Aspergillus clavatus NRRL 1]
MASATTKPTQRGIVSYGSYKTGGWKLKEIVLRPLREKELLVGIVASGICQTDLHFAGAESGFGVHYPRIMGHEGAGYVREIGAGTTIAQVGDPVLLSFSACRACEPCRRGHPAHCTHFNEINFEVEPDSLVYKEQTSPTQQPDIYGRFFGQSSFASCSVVREDSVVNVRGMVDSREELQLLCPLGCGIQTGSGAIINAAQAGPSDRVAVMGLGGVGLSAVMGARIAGCKQIIGIDRPGSRLELAKELGATHVVPVDTAADPQAVTDAVLQATGGLGVNITLDTTGVPKLIAQGVRMTAFKGKILQVGTAPEDGTLTIPIHEFMVSGKQFMGVVEGDVKPREYVPKMVQWVKEGRLPLKRIVKFYPAGDFEQAIKDMQSGETIKPVILW